MRTQSQNIKINPKSPGSAMATSATHNIFNAPNSTISVTRSEDGNQEYHLEEKKSEESVIHLTNQSNDWTRLPIHSSPGTMISAKPENNGSSDKMEQQADRVADQVMRVSVTDLPPVQVYRNHSELSQAPRIVNNNGHIVPQTVLPLVHNVLQKTGKPMDNSTQQFMESRIGHSLHQDFAPKHINQRKLIQHPISESNNPEKYIYHTTTNGSHDLTDFSRVRIHTDEKAASSAHAMQALAYTVGNNIVFNRDQYSPNTSFGKRLLAHELTHVVQQSNVIRRYRKPGTFNFGKMDDISLIEDSFDIKTDKESKPWIEQITVEFDTLNTDVNGNTYSGGMASIQYYNNTVKLPDFSFPISGGSRTLGNTDSGTFTVFRIEGVGYNSGAFSGTPGVDYDPANREGPGNRYSKNLAANMSFAVFYNKGEALHAGPLDFSSHGCVHVDWTDYTNIKQLNYHSVIGLTKVKVKYLSKEEIEARELERQKREERLRGASEYRDRSGSVPAP